MKFYIPFGDWSNDGHGRYKNLLVEANSMVDVVFAQKKIKEKYGKDFFYHFANIYQEPRISEEILQALCDTDYSVKEFYLSLMCYDYDEEYQWDEIKVEKADPQTFKEFVELIEWNSESCINLPLETIISMFIHLLNAFGAGIKVCQDYPNIAKVSMDFQGVGYGCFDDE